MANSTTNFEIKCYNDHKQTHSLGLGTVEGGAKPRTVDGHVFAFGASEELLLYQTRGARARGADANVPFDRTTGVGFVAAAKGDYTDGERVKNRNTSLWLANGYGGLSAATAKELGRCDAIAKDKKVNDTTHYGTGAAATSSYICHHTRRISNAIVASDARCIENAFAMRAAASLPLGDRRDGDHAPPPPSGASPAPGPGHDAGSWSDLGSDDDEPFPSHSTAANA